MAAPTSDKNVPQTEFEIPEGWVLVTKPNRKGKMVKYYTNINGQKFYSESDLMSYVRYSQERGFSIYDPDFKPPSTGPFAMPNRFKVQGASTSTTEHDSKNEVCVKAEMQNEAGSHCGAQDEDEFMCAMTLLKISGQAKFPRAQEIKESLHDIECAIALLDLSIKDQNKV